MEQELLTSSFMGFENLVWFFGIVEDRNDPLRMGRVKVRVFGVHPPDKTQVTTDDLPWAMPIQPIYSAAYAGVGTAPVGCMIGTVVFGFFVDGRDAQIPFILGTVAGGLGHLTTTTSTPAAAVGIATGAVGGSLTAAGATAITSNTAATQAAIVNPQNYFAPPEKTVISPKAPIGNLPKELIAKGKIVGQKLMAEFGLEAHQVAGLLGNLAHESNLIPNVSYGNHKGPPGNLAYGYAQWLGPRLTAFKSNASSLNLDPQSDDANISFLIKELHGTKKKAIEHIKQATDVASATLMAYTWFEFDGPSKKATGPQSYAHTLPSRVTKANLIYNGLVNANVSARGSQNVKIPHGDNRNSG